MSGGGGGGAGASKAAAPIPAGARKLVQSLKEIVNCPESEIYAMLRECNMDPDEAVNRLLAQDTFHEVRSKRDKKKEIKDPPESRPRAVNNISGRGPRSGSDRGGRSTSSQTSSIDYGVGRSKPAGKKENGANAIPTSVMMETTMVESNPSWGPTVSSYPVDTALQATNLVDGYSIHSHPTPGFQNNWLGKPGHVSMADIVKIGRPQGKPSNMTDRPYVTQNASIGNMPNYSMKPPTTVMPSESEKKMTSSQESVIPEVGHHIGVAEDQHISHDGWSMVDEPPTRSTMPETSHGDLVSASSSLVVDGGDLNVEPHLHDIEVPHENLNGESLQVESISVSESDKQTQLEASGDAPSEHHEGSFPIEDVSAEVSSVTANLHQISLHDESSRKVVEPNPAVIIPDHLQVTNADCAQLSFGSFASGAFAGPFSAKSLQSNLEVPPVVDNASSLDQSDSRNDYYNDGQLQSTLSEDVHSRSGINTGNLDTSSASQAEVVRSDTLDSIHNLGYELPSVSYAFSSTTQPSATTFTYPQENAQLQNLAFSNLMQPSTLQSNLLSPNVPALRDFDLPFSHLLTNQSISTKYISPVSAIGTPNISLQEAVKQGVFSNPQPSQQNLASTTIPTGPAPPQQLAVHHYSQPALPLGPFANMISYPFLPPSYSYLPSAAFQQAYSANGPFQQSPAAVPNTGIKYGLPQYKNSVSVTSLPQSATVASAYGGFGSSVSVPGNFTINPSTSSASTTAGFDETLGFQYREANQYMPLQQSDNPAMWVQNAGSRTMSALPANFYNYQAQSQQSGFRQNQQPSQFGALGYPNFYQSQAGAPQEHQQNPNEGNLNNAQSMQSQPVHHLWQHNY